MFEIFEAVRSVFFENSAIAEKIRSSAQDADGSRWAQTRL